MNESRKKLLGVIGHPIGHSLSPAMHNAVFDKLKLNCEYFAFDVAPESLESAIRGAKSLGFIGLNVTIPHKVAAVKYTDKLSKEAELLGAVNTLQFTDREIIGHNTDGTGCINALKEAGVDVKNKRVFIIGAGGAARAIAFQCCLSGSVVSLTNRREEKFMAEDLIKDVKAKLNREIKFIELTDETVKEHLKEVDILVHATSVGMKPNTKNSIISGNIIPSNVTVMDIVYNPPETLLLSEARKKGCRTVEGVGMLAHQGAKSQNIWLGINPPVDVMIKAVIDNL